MRKLRKVILSTICIVETLFVMGSITACAVRNDGMTPTSPNAVQQPTTQSTIPPQTTVQPAETQPAETQPQIQTQPQDTSSLPADSAINVADPNVAQPTAAQPNTAQQNTNQPVPSGNEQISLDEAKTAALTDAGVSAADVIYTKEKLDYEDGIAVYDIEFYAGNVEYEYEINAATGAVYSKSVETHQNQNGHGHQGSVEMTTGTDISAEGAKAIALNHAGFSEADVSRLKTEFDIDDGLSVYEVEFYKDGREYEYKINAADGSIIEFDVD